MSDKPALVFVPGAWHKARCYDKIIKILQANGFPCAAVSLPSTSGDPNATNKDDIDATRAIICEQIDRGRDVVVIAHSYGGIVGNSAIKGLTRGHISDGSIGGGSSRGIVGLILIASGHATTGVAMMEPFCGLPLPFFRVNKDTGFVELAKSPRNLFYHDLPADEGDYWVGELTPHSTKSLYEGGEFVYAGWQDVPSWYIGTLYDKALPVFAQRMTVGIAQGYGANITDRWLATSHSPFLSQPNETAQVIEEAAKDFQNKQARPDQRSSVRLWQYVWWNYGIMNGIGRWIGGTMLFGRWLGSFFRSR